MDPVKATPTTKFPASLSNTILSLSVASPHSPCADARMAAFISFCVSSAVGSASTAAKCLAAASRFPPCR